MDAFGILRGEAKSERGKGGKSPRHWVHVVILARQPARSRARLRYGGAVGRGGAAARRDGALVGWVADGGAVRWDADGAAERLLHLA